jgi:hypothetical protein
LYLTINCCNKDFTKTFYVEFTFISYRFYSYSNVVYSDTFSIVYGINNELLYDNSFFINRDSILIETLKKQNAAYPFFSHQALSRTQHYIFSLRDGTFECVADGFSFKIISDEIEV